MQVKLKSLEMSVNCCIFYLKHQIELWEKDIFKIMFVDRIL